VIDRTAGEGRYARVEREQRWVLRALPDERDRPVSIADLYLDGTRLRVRRMETETGVVYKLGQKVRPEPANPGVVKLTNMYLSAEEYSTLIQVGGAEILKTRWRWTPGPRTLAVDEFQGRLGGLIMAEVELHPDERRLDDPPLAAADVTDDDRFSGGVLAATTSAEIAGLLADLGVGRDGGRAPNP
jgi:CYTH domain-containing protein